MAKQEDTPRETPRAKSHRSDSFSADDFTTMGQSDRELILQWLRSVDQNLQHQLDNVSARVLQLDNEQMRHLEAHAALGKPSSFSPRNEMIVKWRGLSARGKASWIAIILLLAALTGLAWRAPIRF